MFWILFAVFFIALLVGVIYPVAAIIFFKLFGFVSGKKSTVKQIMNAIGY